MESATQPTITGEIPIDHCICVQKSYMMGEIMVSSYCGSLSKKKLLPSKFKSSYSINQLSGDLFSCGLCDTYIYKFDFEKEEFVDTGIEFSTFNEVVAALNNIIIQYKETVHYDSHKHMYIVETFDIIAINIDDKSKKVLLHVDNPLTRKDKFIVVKFTKISDSSGYLFVEDQKFFYSCDSNELIKMDDLKFLKLDDTNECRMVINLPSEKIIFSLHQSYDQGYLLHFLQVEKYQMENLSMTIKENKVLIDSSMHRIRICPVVYDNCIITIRYKDVWMIDIFTLETRSRARVDGGYCSFFFPFASVKQRKNDWIAKISAAQEKCDYFILDVLKLIADYLIGFYATGTNVNFT